MTSLGNKTPGGLGDEGAPRYPEMCPATVKTGESLPLGSGNLRDQALMYRGVTEPVSPGEENSPVPTGFSLSVLPKQGRKKFRKHL